MIGKKIKDIKKSYLETVSLTGIEKVKILKFNNSIIPYYEMQNKNKMIFIELKYKNFSSLSYEELSSLINDYHNFIQNNKFNLLSIKEKADLISNKTYLLSRLKNKRLNIDNNHIQNQIELFDYIEKNMEFNKLYIQLFFKDQQELNNYLISLKKFCQFEFLNKEKTINLVDSLINE